VRRLTAADDPRRLRLLRLEMLADTPVAFLERVTDAERHPPSYWVARLRRYDDADRVMYVAEAPDGDWVAQAGGYLATGRDAAYLVSVYVRPAHRGSGLLERMVGPVVDWARGKGCARLLLEVAAANGRAVAAYRRLGFTPTGRTQQHPLYPAETELEMARSL
jgi:GNAT superfamily N-acetyltransferase